MSLAQIAANSKNFIKDRKYDNNGERAYENQKNQQEMIRKCETIYRKFEF